MGAHWLHDIGQALGGLWVNYYPGWETRSRSSGGFDAILGVCVHHTASQTSPGSDMKYMWESSGDRPIGNIYLGRDGVVTVGCAGGSNTQGKGGPLYCSRGTVPLDSGNKFMIAIEAANNGAGEAWPKAQTDAYIALVRQLCAHYRLSVGQDVYGHYDYCAPSCPGRKIDPAGPSPFGAINASGTWDINAFRAAVFYPPEPELPVEEEEDMSKELLVQISDGPYAGGLCVATAELSRMTWLSTGEDHGALAASGNYAVVKLSWATVERIPGAEQVDIIEGSS